jgi:acyl carrier protein
MGGAVRDIGELKRLLTDVAGVPAELVARLDADTRLADLGLDSVAYLSMQCEIEERYGLVVNPADLLPMQTAGEVVRYLAAL